MKFIPFLFVLISFFPFIVRAEDTEACKILSMVPGETVNNADYARMVSKVEVQCFKRAGAVISTPLQEGNSEDAVGVYSSAVVMPGKAFDAGEMLALPVGKNIINVVIYVDKKLAKLPQGDTKLDLSIKFTAIK
jgi:hypothetical protein